MDCLRKIQADDFPGSVRTAAEEELESRPDR